MRAAVYASAGLFSLILSLIISINQAIVNPDAVCYLSSANEAAVYGVRAAMNICGQATWPFYPVLVGYFSKFTLLSVTTSAYLLDALATLVTVLAFLATVEKLGATRRVMWLAVLVILSAHQFNAVRQYIVRDHGFWAFYMISFLMLLTYLQKPRWLTAIAFAGSLVMAALFRIEGFIYLALLPIFTFFYPATWRERAVSFIRLNSLIILTALALVAWLLIKPEASMSRLGRLPELFAQLTQGLQLISAKFAANKGALIQHVLPHEAARDAGLLWVVVIAALYCLHIINHVSWVVMALVVYALLGGVVAKFSRAGKYALYSFLAANLCITSVFFVERLFFAKRYLIALSLILLLIVPFALNQLLESASFKKRLAAKLAALVLIVSTLGVIFNHGDSKQYVHDAGDWLATSIPHDKLLYTNDLQLAYYSKHYGSHLFVKMREFWDTKNLLEGEFKVYDYLAVRETRSKDQQILTAIQKSGATPVKVFKNQSGDQVIIYKMPQMAEAE